MSTATAFVAACITLLVLGMGTAAAEAQTAEPTMLPLRYGVERELPLGMRVEMAPVGLLVAKGGDRGARVLGYTSFLKVKSCADLVMFKSELEAFADGSGATTRWSVGVYFGGELQPMQVVGHIVSSARSVVRQVR